MLRLGGISKIELFLDENNENNFDSKNIFLELVILFNSKEDKLYKLVNDYLHTLNSSICQNEETPNNKSCLLCNSFVNENLVNYNLNEKEYKIEVILFRIDEFDTVNESNYKRLTFNIENELKHYRSIGIIPNSITDYYIFPLSIMQYSNAAMCLKLKDSNKKTLIWKSKEFSINDLKKIDNGNLNNINNSNSFYIYNGKKEKYGIVDFKNPNNNNGEDNILRLNMKKYKIINIVKRTKELHSLLKLNRKNLIEIFEITKLFRDVESKDNNDDDNRISTKIESFISNIENNYTTSNSNKINHIGFNYNNEYKIDKIQMNNSIEKIKENHITIEKMINDARIEINNNLISVNKLKHIINKYRNNIILNVSNNIYPISILNNGYLNNLLHIRGITLPIINVIQSYNNNDDKDISTSLGYVMHYILIISEIMNIPLSHQINYKGSFSTINDTPLYIYPNVSSKQIKRSLLYLKSLIYHQLLNYFNINHKIIRKLLSTNNILLWLLTIKNVILNEYYN
ncbi:hypothetical protein FG379_003244 [Cryptosporidium bovis]|uniref:uncharacterized protein n=1 Tax=Cryptosporidium bovis TaxID=310047 RepID=UPI00351A30B6|nr:hypothetical protein FG379_003244 [Cryptosporidium bovis]